MAQDTRTDTRPDPIEITTPAGSNLVAVIRIATDALERHLEAGNARAAAKDLDRIREYAVKGARAARASR